MKPLKCCRWGCKNPATRMLPVTQRGTIYKPGMSVPWYHFCDEHAAEDLTRSQR